MVRVPAAADDSLAEILARIKLGIAMAAMIRMIATTISNSINEKPFCFFMVLLFSFSLKILSPTRFTLRSTLHAIFADKSILMTVPQQAIFIQSLMKEGLATGFLSNEYIEVLTIHIK